MGRQKSTNAAEEHWNCVLRMPESMRSRVLAMQQSTDAPSVVQVFREALAVYEIVIKAAKEHQTIIFRDNEDGTEQIFVPIARQIIRK